MAISSTPFSIIPTLSFNSYSNLWTLPAATSTTPTSCELIYTTDGSSYPDGYTFGGGNMNFNSTWWETHTTD